MRVQIKPFSTNQIKEIHWVYGKPRLGSTKEYRDFIFELKLKLPNGVEIPDGKLELQVEFGVSNPGFDLDNGMKAFIDGLQAKYKFNDNRIYAMDKPCKRIVPKGEEYIDFKIYELGAWY